MFSKTETYNPNYYGNKIKQVIIDAKKNGIRVEFTEDGLEIENTTSENCILIDNENSLNIDSNSYLGRQQFESLPVGTEVYAICKGGLYIERPGYIELNPSGNKRVNVFDGCLTFEEANIKRCEKTLIS